MLKLAVLGRRTISPCKASELFSARNPAHYALPVKIALALDAEAYCRYEALDDTAAEAKWQDTRLACFAKPFWQRASN